MMERFNDESRRVIVLAQEEARRLSHDWIGTEHLLLGLIREDEGVAAKALATLGIGLADARRRVEEVTGRGEGEPPEQMRFSPLAKADLEGSLREALRLGDGRVGPEHILLSMVREPDGQAATILTDAGAPPAEVRSQVLRLRAAGQDAAPG